MGRVVLVDGDLLARARVEEAARAAGHEVVAIDSRGGGDVVAADPAFVIVDLDRGRQAALEVVRDALARGLEAPVLGFFSHVDAALGTAAEASGVKTFRRGRFWAELPGLLSG